MGDGGTGGTGDNGFVDPLPVDKQIALGCVADVLPVPFIAQWELSVDPSPIIAMKPFLADLSGTIVVAEADLDQSLGFVGGGYKRLSVLEANATVRVHGNATDSSDVHTGKLLTLRADSFACTYDEQGNVGPHAGPFRKCEPSNDNPDGSNADCTGLAGGPHPEDHCGLFITIPTSSDSRECEEVHGKGDDWSSLGFCVTGDLRIPLEPLARDYDRYEADEAGEVLFGLDERNGEKLGVPAFDSETGPNGFRARLRGTHPLAVECMMVGSSSSPTRFDPTSVSDFISFAVQGT